MWAGSRRADFVICQNVACCNKTRDARSELRRGPRVGPPPSRLTLTLAVDWVVVCGLRTLSALRRRGSRWRSPPPVGHAVGLSAPRRPVAPQVGVGLRVFGRRTAAAPRAPSRLRVRAPWPKLHYCIPDALLYHVRSVRSSALRRDECTTARTPTAYICSLFTSTLSPLVGTR